MKNYRSLLACLVVALVFIQHRVYYAQTQPLKLTTWDALGYYMYLPALSIYSDAKELKWMPAIDSTYKATGGEMYQAQKHKNGNFVFKYLGGVALLQYPFFKAAHIYAKQNGYPRDGFSPPYQYAVAIAAMFYFFLGLFVLRRVLLRYFSDITTSITLLLLCLATNLIQYSAIEGGMSHIYIFPLYALVLYTTIKWHERPKIFWAVATGYIIGLATICRPTEAVMLFIPLFWGTQTKEAAQEKWKQVKANKQHIWLAVAGGLLGILPQMLYWKATTGSFIYDVGSAWRFASPYFRVLFGWEKGWFIYTPVTIFFVLGLFFMRGYAFRKAAIWFCLLNIYIIIAWADWQYGASYSTRALVQSYPLFALPFAAIITRINASKWKWGFYALSLYLIVVNLFQVWQYNTNVLHYKDMNRKYYAAIYLNPAPTPLQMSLLDSCDIPGDLASFSVDTIRDPEEGMEFGLSEDGEHKLWSLPVSFDSTAKEWWIKVDADINVRTGLWGSFITIEFDGDKAKRTSVRLFNAISKEGQSNHYSFFAKVPEGEGWKMMSFYVSGKVGFWCKLEQLVVTKYERKKLK